MTCPFDDDDDDYDKGANNDDANNDKFIDEWFYLSLGLGFAVGILVPYLVLATKKSWSEAYFNLVDKVVKKL